MRLDFKVTTLPIVLATALLFGCAQPDGGIDWPLSLSPRAVEPENLPQRESEFRAGDSATAPPEMSLDLSDVETFPEMAQQIVERTNAYRQQHDLAAVQPQPELMAAADRFARFMAKTDQYGHQADARQPWERAEAQGYDYCSISENIAWQSGGLNSRRAERFVNGWIESEHHRENLLDSNVIHTGVATAYSPASRRYYAVQMFGRPSSATISFTLANRSGRVLHYRLADRDFELPRNRTVRHRTCGAGELEIVSDNGDVATTLHAGDGAQLVVRRVTNEGVEVDRR